MGNLGGRLHPYKRGPHILKGMPGSYKIGEMSYIQSYHRRFNSGDTMLDILVSPAVGGTEKARFL